MHAGDPCTPGLRARVQLLVHDVLVRDRQSSLTLLVSCHRLERTESVKKYVFTYKSLI